MTASGRAGALGRVYARVCLMSRGLRWLPGLRGSMGTKLTLAALLPVAPLVFLAVAPGEATNGYSARPALVMLVAAIGLAAFAITARCLVQPIERLAKMVRGYRMGEPLQPPAEIHFDEIGALTGEIVQTLREADAHLARRGDDAPIDLPHAGETAARSSGVQTGSARVRTAESSAELGGIEKLSLELGDAIDRGEIEAHFQLRVDADTGHWKSAQALARWQHPERGAISPATFIPMASTSGRIVDIGRIMLDRAVAAVAAWDRVGIDLNVSVNVDAEQLVDGTLEHDVTDALQRHGVAPHSLELEITETSLPANPEAALTQITALRSHGVHFALDDFGTGYSPLGYLGRLPVDRISIDRSFVIALDTAEGRRLVRAITDLARGLSLRITAEGVENEAQADRLREFGCDELQGFLYARAMPAHAITQTNRPGRPPTRRDALMRPIEAGSWGGMIR